MKKLFKFVLIPLIFVSLGGCNKTKPKEPVTLSDISLSGNYKTEFF